MASKKAVVKKADYSADSIKVLKGLEPVRKRPGMYIGECDERGLHHLVWEIFDNSRDEAMNGHADRIEITLLPDGYVRVVDNGRGIPVDMHPTEKVSALEIVMTTLHGGGKFNNEDEENGSYKFSGGLHGVGASVVNALSIHCKAEVHREGGYYMQEYATGIRKAVVKLMGKSKKRGTIITFKPDNTIFKETTTFSFEKITSHIRQQAYLVSGTKISVLDAREYKGKIQLDGETYLMDIYPNMQSFSFYFDGGLPSLLRHHNIFSKPIHRNIFYVEKEYEGMMVEVALQYIDDIATKMIAFANNIPNSEGGTHVAGFKTTLTRLINSYARKNNIIKEKDENLSGDDVLEGLTAIVSVKMREVQFSSQTKSKLTTLEAQSAVSNVFAEAFNNFLEENPDDAKEIVSKGILALRSRKAAKAAKDSILRKGVLDSNRLPGKLADCQSNSAEESELFIVEGDSAGGTAKMGRDRRTQAILPLRGKILNVERARLDRMLGSEQVKNLVLALGAAIGDTFDISKIRYHKIIIATDADIDGAHIRTLLLTFFFRYYKEVIDKGYIYIAQPPLYKLTKGKQMWYAQTDADKFKLVAQHDIKGDNIQRYKGLGEMNADELKETTMDINNRVLKQVSADDADAANKVFEMLMGAEVGPRKSFIQAYAHEADVDA